jgi:hypothetical protein
MKKILFLILIVFLSQETVSFSKTFSDIDESNPYFLAITYLSDKNILSGYSDGSFQALNNINRAELLKIAIEAKGIELETPKTNCFTDVPYTEWYAKYVCTAKTLNYINGYEDGTFKPSQNINKVEALKIIGEIFNWELESSSDTEIFTDTPKEEWYFQYIQYGKSKNLLPESGGKYNPENYITRGSVSETLFRMMAASELNEDSYSNTVLNTIKETIEEELKVNENQSSTNEITISLKGIITDATTGFEIENASVTLYDENDNYISKTTSGKEGSFNMDIETNEESYILFSKDGYYSFETKVNKIQEDEIHVSLSKTFSKLEPEELRIVLTWGNADSDFDAHLITPKEEEIFFMYRINPAKDVLLETDSTEKNGTETIAIKSLQEGTYGYFVHNYSNTNDFKSSDVRVDVYDKNGLAKTYYPPESETEIWYVFTLNSSGEITDINLNGSCETLEIFSSICPKTN